MEHVGRGAESCDHGVFGECYLGVALFGFEFEGSEHACTTLTFGSHGNDINKRDEAILDFGIA